MTQSLNDALIEYIEPSFPAGIFIFAGSIVVHGSTSIYYRKNIDISIPGTDYDDDLYLIINLILCWKELKGQLKLRMYIPGDR